jgi:hypothetical protein
MKTTNVKTSILEQGFEVQSIEKKIPGNIYEPKVTIEDKVYPEMYYKHQLGSVIMDEILQKHQSIGITYNWMYVN